MTELVVTPDRVPPAVTDDALKVTVEQVMAVKEGGKSQRKQGLITRTNNNSRPPPSTQTNRFREKDLRPQMLLAAVRSGVQSLSR